MTADELRAAIGTLWGGNQSRAARELNIAPRTIRAFLSGTASARPISEGVAREVRDLLRQFPEGISEASPRKTIPILHEMLVASGWTDAEAAAAILGYATAHAAQYGVTVETLDREPGEATPAPRP